MDFGGALDQLRQGNYVARQGWNGKGQHIALQVPDEHSKMGLPYLYIRTVTGDLVPWTPSQTDILASDWLIVGPVRDGVPIVGSVMVGTVGGRDVNTGQPAGPDYPKPDTTWHGNTTEE